MNEATGGERRRRSSSLHGAEDSLTVALEPLSRIVVALWPHARLTALSVHGDALEVVASTGAAPLRVGTMLQSHAVSAFRRTLLDQGPFVAGIEDAEPEALREALRQFGFQRAFVAPLHSVDDVSQCVVIDEPGRPMAFDEHDRRLLAAAVDQAKAALENEDLRARASKRQRTFEAIARLGVIFTSVLDLKQTASQVVEYAALLLDMPAFALLFRPDGATDFMVLAAEGLPPEASSLRVRPLEIAALDVKAPGEIGARSLPESAPGSLFDLLEREGLTNVFVAPLIVGEDRLRGVLLGLDRRKLEPRTEELEAVHLLAMQATNAIWTAERYEAEVEARREAKQESDFVTRLVEELPFPVSYLDRDLVYRRCNTAAAASVGLRPDQIIGRAAQEIIGADSEVIGLLGGVLQTGEPYSGTIEFTAPGSTDTTHYRVSYIPDKDEQGRVFGVLTDVFDVTELMIAQERAKQELETTSRLLDAANVLADWTDLDQLLAGLTDVLLRNVRHSRIVLTLWEEERRAVVVHASAGIDPLTEGTVIPYDTFSVAGKRAMETLSATVVDYESLPKAERGSADENKYRLSLLIPLKRQTKFLGFMTLDDARARREFTQREIDIAEAIGSQASGAIENAQLLESEREVARLTESLNVVSESIHSTLEFDEAMQQALDEGVKALACDSGTIEMLEAEAWVVRYVHGFSSKEVGARLGEHDTPFATRGAQTREAFAIPDASADEKLNVGFVATHGLKSVLAVPLLARGTVIGCALFYTSKAVRHFSNSEIDFGRKLGDSVSLAMVNARLYEFERDIADRLQGALLSMPDRIGGIEFAHAYHSATEAARVGGDFYDVFELNNHLVGITIGDVAGHGLEAAVLTALAKHTIRAHAEEMGKTPNRILELTNDIVFRSTSAELFVTVFFGILDRRDGRLVYANAGHTTAGLVRPDGTTARLPATGPLLGAFAGSAYEQAESYLGLRDLLFLYTDGLTEARRGRQLYGEERLFAFLSSVKDGSPSHLVEQVIGEVMSFSGNSLRDDLAILALKRAKHEAETSTQGRLEL